MQNVAGWPTNLGARVVALRWLEDASQGADRLDVGNDVEALHDFRVGIRRLRVVLKAYRPWLKDTVSRKRRRKLGAIGRATGPARDLEVQSAWLRSQTPESGAEAAARADLLGHMDRAASDTSGLDKALRAFRRQTRRLRSELTRIRVTPLDFEGSTDLFGPTSGSIVRARQAEVIQSLAAIGGHGDDPAIHSARIGVKRLRYLYHPFVPAWPACTVAYDSLGTLQELLGGLHDRALLARRIEVAKEWARDERVVAGYVLLAWRAGRTRLDLFRTLRRDWMRPGALDGLSAALRELAPCDAGVESPHE